MRRSGVKSLSDKNRPLASAGGRQRPARAPHLEPPGDGRAGPHRCRRGAASPSRKGASRGLNWHTGPRGRSGTRPPPGRRANCGARTRRGVGTGTASETEARRGGAGAGRGRADVLARAHYELKGRAGAFFDHSLQFDHYVLSKYRLAHTHPSVRLYFDRCLPPSAKRACPASQACMHRAGGAWHARGTRRGPRRGMP